MKILKYIFRKSKEKGIFSRVILPVAALLSATFLYLFIHQYSENFKVAFAAEAQSYMQEIAQQVTQVVDDKIETNLKNLETDAIAMAAIDANDQKTITDFLSKEAKRYGYASLSLVNLDGVALSDQGKSYHVAARPYILAALRGKASVSDLIASDFSNMNSIEFAAPVKDGDTVTGVLVAGYELNDLQDILKVSIFGGKGKASVIDSKGIVIVSNEENQPYNLKYSMKQNGMIQEKDYERFSKDLIEERSGALSFTQNEEPMMMYYQPMGVNDWTLLITAPSEQIIDKTNLFIKGIVNIGIVIAALVAFLMMIVVVLQIRGRRMLEKLLYVDPVTEGISYAKLANQAKRRIEDKPPGYYLLLQLNIEKFKLVNTTYGRAAGNRLLKYVYHVIQRRLLPDELVARTDADRFCLLLRSQTEDSIDERMEAFVKHINQFNENNADKYYIRFNAGVCVIDSCDTDLMTYYERANFTRTSGKRMKSNQGIAFYNEIEREIIMREQEIENRMEEALSNGEFEVYLQPKYELDQDHIAGAEALVRWKDPIRGMINPGDFIPLFERNGFIIKLDLYMFEEVCKIQKNTQMNQEPCVPISVNLSRRHLEHSNFLQHYKEIFEKYQFPPELLEIELTESIVFDNMDQLCQIIDDIHEIGFQCSMDDFGSGYSSLNMLKEIPVDVLKLDRAFFYSKSGDESKSRYVIENVIDLASKLHMKTVSEGIESKDQVEYLRRVHCDMIQGFVFARPMPVSDFQELLKRDRASAGNL